MKYRKLLQLLKDDGWQLARTRGSHLIFIHPTKAGHVTVPSGEKTNQEVKPGALRNVFRQAGIEL